MTYRTEFPTYSTAHRRVNSLRGRAADHQCIDCGGAADEWSYNHRDPFALHEIIGHRSVSYSADPANYDPRCRSCHLAFDRPVEPREYGPETSEACGTYGGAQRHRKKGERLCRRCRDAKIEYVRRWRRRKEGSLK